MPSRAPVLLFQWRPPDERDEIVEAKRLLESEHARGDKGRAQGVLPSIAAHTCTHVDPAEFAADLERALSAMPQVQVLYLSAHGLPDAIARDRDGNVRLDFNDLRPFLERGLEHSSDVTIVFGLCHALSSASFALSILPPAIVQAYGFTGTPEARDVAALVAGILADDVVLMENVTKENTALFGKGVPFDQAGPVFEELARRLEAQVDQHEATHEPEFFVRGSKGGAVRHMRRGTGGRWEAANMPAAVPGRIGERDDAD